jgi:hypothetical protein
LALFYRIPNYEALGISMIPVDFFGCKREQIVTCSWEEACHQFPCTGITIPDTSALISLSEALTGGRTFSAEPVPLSIEPFYELADRLKTAVREATAEDLMDAGARWAQLSPWDQLDTNPMDLAGFLLQLQSLVQGPGKEENSIFLSVESGDLPSS